jgi:hypothetical protein
MLRVAAGRTLIRRLSGTSDIIYVGSTAKGGTIRGRLREHLTSRKDEKGVGWQIDRVLKAVGPLEVGWRTFGTADEAANHESLVLRSYQKNHIELPPLNNQMPQRAERLSEEDVQRAFDQLPADGVVKLLCSLDANRLREVRARLVKRGKLKV